MLIWRQLRIVWRSGDVGEETRCGRGNTRKQLKVKIPTTLSRPKRETRMGHPGFLSFSDFSYCYRLGRGQVL